MPYFKTTDLRTPLIPARRRAHYPPRFQTPSRGAAGADGVRLLSFFPPKRITPGVNPGASMRVGVYAGLMIRIPE
jgi:hypothetical protein